VLFDVEVALCAMELDGHLAINASARDIGDRKRAEGVLRDAKEEMERQIEERTASLRKEIQARILTDEALRESRERLKGIADNLVEGVLVINHQGYLSFANASAKRLLGWDGSAGDIEGQPVDDVVRLLGDDGDIPLGRSPWPQVTEAGTTLTNDDALMAIPSGKILQVAYSCYFMSEDGGRISIIVSFRDIKLLKETQREAIQASRLASVGQLAAGIAHEINTPIQYVGDNLGFIGRSLERISKVLETVDTVDFASAVKAAKLPSLLRELPEAVSESLDGIAQIARIVLSMKEFSHPGSTTKVTADINRALENTLTISRSTWKHVAQLQKELDPSLPPVQCLVGEMNQVFLNLLINATHAIEASGKPLPGVISVSTKRVGEDVVICIGDSGTGIPEAIREKIFDPFFTTKDVGKGTGQGLAICRNVVVAKHGGRLDVEGREGEGAIFRICLPIYGVTGDERDEDP